MVNQRSHKTNRELDKKIHEFAAKSEKKPKLLDPNAKRDFKSKLITFNEYEFNQLEALAQKTGRSYSNAIRWAIGESLDNLDL